MFLHKENLHLIVWIEFEPGLFEHNVVMFSIWPEEAPLES